MAFDDSPMFDAIKNGLGEKGVLKYFNDMLMGANSDDKVFSPDISGYTLIFMIPPNLSGYKGIQKGLADTSKMFALLALDFTPPPVQVVATSLPIRAGSLSYATEVNMSGQITITFLDTDELECFEFHKVWIAYIEAVTRGTVSPNSEYYEKKENEVNGKFGIVDYVTSAYVVRFKMTGDIVYVGKATGIFPLNLPDKEIIGRRDSNELTILPINYSCVLYRQQVKGKLSKSENWILDELEKLLNNYL